MEVIDLARSQISGGDADLSVYVHPPASWPGLGLSWLVWPSTSFSLPPPYPPRMRGRAGEDVDAREQARGGFARLSSSFLPTGRTVANAAAFQGKTSTDLRQD